MDSEKREITQAFIATHTSKDIMDEINEAMATYGFEDSDFNEEFPKRFKITITVEEIPS